MPSVFVNVVEANVVKNKNIQIQFDYQHCRLLALRQRWHCVTPRPPNPGRQTFSSSPALISILYLNSSLLMDKVHAQMCIVSNAYTRNSVHT